MFYHHELQKKTYCVYEVSDIPTSKFLWTNVKNLYVHDNDDGSVSRAEECRTEY